MQTNGINGGFGVASVRPMLGYDRVLMEGIGPGSLAAGLRLGFAIGGSPTPSNSPPSDPDGSIYQDNGQSKPPVQANGFLPIHAEVRGTYFIFGNTMQMMQPSPYVFFGGGLAQVNASVPVNVCDSVDKKGQGTANTKNGQCPEGTTPRLLDAYQITGLNFVGLGGGTTFGITDEFGVAAEIKVMFMLPTFGIVFEPTIGPVYSF